MNVRRLIVVGGVAAAALTVWLGQRARGGDAPAPLLPEPVRDEVVAPGRVEGQGDAADLSFELGGRVAEVMVQEGQAVRVGQVLARLDDRLARARVAEAEAALAGARARRDAAFRGSRLAEIRAAEAEADAARAQANDEESEQARAQRLLAARAITPAEAERRAASASAAAARAAAAGARLALAREGTRDELKRAALAEVAAAEAVLEERRIVLGQTELRTPIAGVVLRRRIEPGEQAVMMPLTIAFTVADTSRLRLRTEVDEDDVARVRVGQTGFAVVQAYGERRFPGRVVRVMSDLGRKDAPTDDPRARVDTRVLEVLFELDEPAVRLPLGLRMEVHLGAPPGPHA